MKNNKNLTANYIENYCTNVYGYFKHDKNQFNYACKKTAKKYGFKPIQVFHFIIENKDFNGFLNSYGFNTSYGREVKNTFEFYYYNLK